MHLLTTKRLLTPSLIQKQLSPFSQDRLTHVQLLLAWNPSPHWPSRVSLEYLLLPPRSVLLAAPGRITPSYPSTPPTQPSYTLKPTNRNGFDMLQRQSISSTLKLLPFSGRRASASELLHTPQMISTSMTTSLLSSAGHTFYGIS